MHRSVLPLLLLALAFAAGCEPSSVSCGPGTRLEGRVCVPDSTVDTGGGDAGALGDIGPRTDGRVDAPGADGGTSFMEGDRCPTDAAGNNLLSPACVGDQMIACNGDFVRVTDCTELGERCVTAADGLPRCDGGVYGACDRATSTNQCADEAHALLCSGGYPNASGYLYTIACASFGAGYECLTDATGSGGCYPPGTVPCTVPGSRCMGDAIVTCRDGLEYTVPCDERTPGGVCDVDGGGEPVCVPPWSMRCDTRTFHGSCPSDTRVEQCDPTTAHVALFGCAAGTTCRVSASGFADCVAADVLSCDVATHVPRCLDHDRMAVCDRFGFESGIDCTRGGPDARCIPESPARCGVALDCDPGTFTARCVSEHAQNCLPGGYLDEEICSPFSPCRVVDGVAACGF